MSLNWIQPNQFTDNKLDEKKSRFYEWSKSNLTDWEIKWNVKGISGEENGNGYIVQKMHMRSDFPLIHIDRSNYYEAWKVENGLVEKNGCDYDDKWETFGLDLIDKDAIKKLGDSLGGAAEYRAKVYWVPFDSKEYSAVDSWGQDIETARGLKSAHDINFDIKKYFQFERRKRWNCAKTALNYFHAKEEHVNLLWNYYVMLEEDLNNTARYIEPKGQEETYSFEFAKLLILSCSEAESLFWLICKAVNEEANPGDIGEYKQIILGECPQITETVVYVSRLGKYIRPFDGWNRGPLPWWGAYQDVKHSLDGHLYQATYMNAATALSALYILMLYLARIIGVSVNTFDSKYIWSPYADRLLSLGAEEELPDFKQQKN